MKTTYIAAGIVIGILAVAIAGITFSGNKDVEAQMGMMNHGSMEPGMMTTGSTSSTNQWQTQFNGFSSSGTSIVDNVRVTGVSIAGDDQVTVSLRYSGAGESPGVVVVATTNPTGMMSGMHNSMGMTGYGSMGQGMMYGYSGMMGPGATYGQGMMGPNMMYGGYGYPYGTTYGQGAMGPGMMYGNNMMGTVTGTAPAWNGTQWQEWHAQMAQWHNQMMPWNGQLNSTQLAEWQAWHNQMMAQAPPVMMTIMHGGTLNGTSTAVPYFQSQTGSSAIRDGWTDGNYKIVLEGDGSAYDSGQIMVMVFPLTS